MMSCLVLPNGATDRSLLLMSDPLTMITMMRKKWVNEAKKHPQRIRKRIERFSPFGSGCWLGVHFGTENCVGLRNDGPMMCDKNDGKQISELRKLVQIS